VRLPITGLGGSLSFRLSSEGTSQFTILSCIRIPCKADLVAAFVLEQLCVALRVCGYSFSHAETGNGTYASSGCDLSGMAIFLLVSREDDLFELQIMVAEQVARGLRLRGPSKSPPSDEQRSLWSEFRMQLDRELVRSLVASEIAWSDDAGKRGE
jgi:hypothetical protein